LWLADPREFNKRYPDWAPQHDAVAWAVLPLVIDDVIQGAVGWSFRRRDITDKLRGYTSACSDGWSCVV
jgi:hypothetical protein